MYIQNANLLRLLSNVFRASYNVLIPADGEIGVALPNGNWTGMLGLVQNTEADMAVGRVMLSENRFKVFNFSYPYLVTEITFMTDKLKPISTSMTLLYPFSFTVWTSLAVFILTFSVLLFVLLKEENLLTVFSSKFSIVF